MEKFYHHQGLSQKVVRHPMDPQKYEEIHLYNYHDK